MEDDKEYEVVSNPRLKAKLYRFKNSHTSLFDFAYPQSVAFKNFEIRDDDVYVSGFPKSGNTWIQEIAYLILNDCDFEKAKSEKINIRAPLLDLYCKNADSFKDLKSPRIFKTHFGVQNLQRVFETKARVIYCIREPKDAHVSWYHYLRQITLADYSGTFEEFIQDVMDDKIPNGPWWSDMNEYNNVQNKHTVFYEDMKQDPFGEIKKLCKYLGKEYNDETINRLVEHSTFQNFKNNPTINYSRSNFLKSDNVYCRKGIIGDWKNHFSKELAEKFDKYISEKLEVKFDRYFRQEMD